MHIKVGCNLIHSLILGDGLGDITGDPHVKVKLPHEEAVCFDFNTQKDSNIYLLRDTGLGLTVTAKMTNERPKFNKAVHSHITAIQIQTAQSQIDLHFCQEESKLKLTVQDSDNSVTKE